MIQLHIGCGNRDFGKEWIHIDGGEFPHVKSHDISLAQYDDNSVDKIYSSHLLEYFDRQEGEKMLKYWHRVLKRGGEIFIAVPDFASISKLYYEKEYELEQFLGLLYGKMDLNGTFIYHKTVYDFKSLCRLMAECGFVGMIKPEEVEGIETNCGVCKHWSRMLPDDHSYAVLPHRTFKGTPVSLNISAYK